MFFFSVLGVFFWNTLALKNAIPKCTPLKRQTFLDAIPKRIFWGKKPWQFLWFYFMRSSLYFLRSFFDLEKIPNLTKKPQKIAWQSYLYFLSLKKPCKVYYFFCIHPAGPTPLDPTPSEPLPPDLLLDPIRTRNLPFQVRVGSKSGRNRVRSRSGRRGSGPEG